MQVVRNKFTDKLQTGGSAERREITIMKRRRLMMTLTAAVLAAVLGAGTAMAEETCKSYLTGETVSTDIGRVRPIAVMFNNIYDAIPQYGIENCGVVYEAPVEGSITRLMGIMEDYQDVPRIGSVRSYRKYYIYLAREFNAIYAHFGQAVYAEPILNLPSTNNLSGLGDYGDLIYYRSEDRVSPHNVFTTYDGIQAGIDAYGYSREYAPAYTGHYQFAEDGETVTLEGGQDALVVLPGYTYNHARFEYDASTGLYNRFQYGDAQVDGNTGDQLAYKNIILQYCDWENFDENGYLNIDVVHGGSGKYITNGKAIDIYWEKENYDPDSELYCTVESQYCSVPVHADDFNVVRYYDMNGNEIKLNQGKTWVCIVRNSYSDHVTISDDPTISSDVIDF